jgi:hypothetical protein
MKPRGAETMAEKPLRDVILHNSPLERLLQKLLNESSQEPRKKKK